MSFFRPPTIYKQGNPPDQSSTSMQSDQVFPIPWVDDLWVDILNHVVKRCTNQNPYTWVSIEGGGGGGSTTFDQIVSGTNITATMTVGTGATLNHSGSGVVDATKINGIPITGALTHAGQIPISQPGNTSAIWADPLVQGIQADGTTATTISPVLVSGKGADGNQHDLSTDNSGNLNVNVASAVVSGTVAVSNFPATQPVSGTVTANAGTNLNTSLLALEAGGNLAAIKADVDKIPSQGQALAAASMPVVLTAAQITTLTPPSSVTVTQGTGTNLHAVLDASAAVIGHVINDASAAVIGHVITDTGSTTAVTGTVAVSGTVTANAGSNLNTSALALESGGNLATVASAVRAEDTASVDADKGIGALAIRKATPGNTSSTDGDYEYLQMNAGRLWASATIDSALPAGTNVIGHVINDASAAVIGHVIADTGSTTAVTGNVTVVQGTGTNLHVVVDTAPSTAVTNAGTFATQSTLAAGTALIGSVSASNETSILYNGTTALTPAFATIAVSATGTLVALVAAKKIRVLSLSLMANGTVNVKFQSHVTPTDITGLYYLIANTGFVLPYNPLGWFQTVAGEALDINLSAGIAVGGCLVYVAV